MRERGFERERIEEREGWRAGDEEREDVEIVKVWGMEGGMNRE